MLDSTAATGADPDVFDLCIVGAGAAGLNALFSALRHLGPDARIALIDRRDVAGGMWRDTYDYVRLHQPHPMFTAGNIPWRLNQPPEYLASRPEVLSHLGHCLEMMSQRARIERLFGHDYLGAREDRDGVTVRHAGPSGEGSLRATRLIVATGYDVEVLQALPLASASVISTAPAHLSPADLDGGGPVYVIGAGKTGMDTCHTLLTRNPDRKVVLIAGNGVAFAKRDLFAPKGARRYWGGQLSTNIFKAQALAFDGTNSMELSERFNGIYSDSLNGKAHQFLFGVLSRTEMDRIRDGLSDTVYDYLADVVDGASGPEMVFRSGARRGVEAGALVVNCTGHLLRRDTSSDPYISDGKRVLTIGPKSSVHFLSTVSAYFLTDMWYRDLLPHADLYACDFPGLFAADRVDARFGGVTVSFLTQCLLVQFLPIDVFKECGLDLNQWFPMYRRLPMIFDLKRNGPRYVAHCQGALDTLAARHGLAIGPVGQGKSQTASMAQV